MALYVQLIVSAGTSRLAGSCDASAHCERRVVYTRARDGLWVLGRKASGPARPRHTSASPASGAARGAEPRREGAGHTEGLSLL